MRLEFYKKHHRFGLWSLVFGLWIFLWFSTVEIKAQSTNQNFPTAVTSNEISGTIRARDIGDARLTTYFYTFNGTQGDVFINVVTKNLDGDIDVFTAEGLRPLTKIRVYSDNPDGETGRVIYLRQPQKLILRIEGRTPTDEPASFRIKFAGSFQPAAAVAESEESKQPEVTSNPETDVRVNSVGTIIEIKPKPTPTVARVEEEEPKKTEVKEPEKAEKEESEIAKKEEPEEESKKPEVVVTENIPEKKVEPETKPEETVAEKATPEKTPKTRRNPRNRRNQNTEKTETKPTTEKKSEIIEVGPEQLAGIRLIVDFKDGRKIELPMNRILKFGVDKGILTIITNDGSIGRYSMLDIAKITIE